MQLKDLPKQRQLQYTQELLPILKQINDPTHPVSWADVQDLRQQYSLEAHSRDSLRRGVLLRELIDADAIQTNSILQELNSCKDDRQVKQSTDYVTNHTTSEAILSLTQEEINNPSVLLQKHGFNPEEFNLLKARHSIWQQGSKEQGENNESNVKNLVSSKIEVEPKNKIVNGHKDITPEEIHSIFEELIEIKNKKDKDNDETQKCQEGYTNYEYDSEMLLIMLSDLHLGRVTTYLETGVHSNLYSEIDLVKQNIKKYLSKFKDRKFEQIVFPIGNDLMNSSFLGKTTQHGYTQDNSTTTREIFKEAANCMIWIIEQLAEMAPVYCPLVVGNHDAYEEYAIALILSAYFKNDGKVHIDVSAQPRKYYNFRNVLLAFSHGQNDKKNLHSILLDEAKNYIRGSSNIYVICGHLHHLEVKEENKVEYWTVPSFTKNDNWTTEKGFSAKQRSVGFIFNSKEMIETHYFSV